MSNNKQSSVEWLDRWFRDNPEATHEEGNKALKQAKAMHKKEILGSWGNGWVNGDVDVNRYEDTAEEFYNETFGGNNEL